jgi:hypothetical protein
VWAPAAAAAPDDDYYLNGLHAYNIDSTGGSADLIQIGQQVCGAISPNVSPSELTPYIYGRNVYTGRIHPLNWRRAYPCHVGAGRHFGSVRGRHLLPRRRGREGGTTNLYSNSPNIASLGMRPRRCPAR